MGLRSECDGVEKCSNGVEVFSDRFRVLVEKVEFIRSGKRIYPRQCTL